MSTDTIRTHVETLTEARRAYTDRLRRVGPREGHVIVHTRLDTRVYAPIEIRIAAARAAIRRARRSHTVHVHDATGRDGIAMRVVHVRYAPDTWDDVKDAVDIYEIPVHTLTAL
ncbi:hypothetical protein [Streptomyces sp. SID3343]|uniref:hypothetical protein n=1 Tax=Streptomyces sp. SID3343 TaxID=2690260 RepID=UPI00136ED371|nr:hypothetical protein [Streptomyces sp. SID3343]MYW06040.1 hypothetical protein [Streptomyces sp. SID3343]